MMKCSSCGHEAVHVAIVGRRIKCLPCSGYADRAAFTTRFEWRNGPVLNSEGDLFCYAVTDSRYHQPQMRYVGMVHYERGNWLERLLWPRRWCARAGFNVGQFRDVYEAQQFVEHHAGGGK